MSTPPGIPYNASLEEQFDHERAADYVIRQIVGAVHTAALVKVLAVRPVSDRVGFVDVQPLVDDVSTAGIVIPQSPAYNLPYVRYQAGVSAVIMDPVAGDIGLAIFAERDITAVKTTKKEGPAATAREHSSADGLYIGGVLNAAPTQYVKFQPAGAGIDIVSPGEITLQAGSTITITSGTTTTVNAPGGLVINANTTFNGNVSGTTTGTGSVSFAAPITAPDFRAPNANLNTHQHAVSGGSTTGNPHN